MLIYEIEPLINSLQERTKENWEQARLIAYVVAQCNSTKKIKPTDVVLFIWDVDSDTGISNEDIERLKMKAKQYSKKRNG